MAAGDDDAGAAAMLTVACVLRSGGIYTTDWVARLRDGVGRHLPIVHRFVCLSDVDVPCERVPLINDWPGWWAKFELFRLDGPLLYFDLDTAIVGDLSDLANHAETRGFSALEDFYRPGGIGTGVMTWPRRVDMFYLHDAFAANPEAIMAECGARGDQGFLEDEGIPRYPLQVSLPGQIVSYKVHCRHEVPSAARVVCLHGEPKFEAMPADDPVRLAWEQAA